MRGTAILRVHLYDEDLSRIGVSGPTPHDSPLALGLIQDEVRSLATVERGCLDTGAQEENTDPDKSARNSHRAAPWEVRLMRDATVLRT
jgi:hypothetical protein